MEPGYVLSAEDHLRILCLHLLKHGAWRPLWLCDVGAALESRPSGFDWDRCLGKNKHPAEWVLCTLALAHRLLEAELGDAPVKTLKSNAKGLPDWLISSVLRQWCALDPPNLPSFALQVRGRWWKRDVLQAIRERWPNPIQASVDADAKFDRTPRLPFQLGQCLARMIKLGPQLRGLRRG